MSRGTAEDVAPHRVMEGNRPPNVLLAEVLTPYREAGHPSQGTIWGIDSFDQWGVELGKVLAVAIISELESATEPEFGHNSSTNALIRHYRTLKD
ncbi:hypothetical protein OG698_10325 [Streptomyces sp. NBC_01003]|uniref:hypothetical protein n=1 Tax=Streptomyces sp. NBC_01003 TaxID=2903714 RepID=UPI00386A872D|nr:hypothetical protein OG698_10325 [Streptomyces sp. NBC_01003]